MMVDQQPLNFNYFHT